MISSRLFQLFWCYYPPQELLQLAKIMRDSPELRELLRNLGRRSAVRGPLHKLPEDGPCGDG
jgi:hypothetical protein